MLVYMYLQKVPSHEKCGILGCHWLSKEWNPSRQLVCDSDESYFMSFRIRVFISMSFNLSYSFVPGIDNLLLVFMLTVLNYITKYIWLWLLI